MAEKTSKIFWQSGVVPYRIHNGKVEILLITTRDNKNWVIPKGGIASGMTPPDSAAKEAWEEAGIIGRVNTSKQGIYKYRKGGKTYQVKLYPLAVEDIKDNYPEAGKRRRLWLEVEVAIELIKKNSLKQIIKDFTEVESHLWKL